MKELISKARKLMFTLFALVGSFNSFVGNGYSAFENLFWVDLAPHSCDQLVTFDIVSNREWLDLSQTVNFSFSDLTGPSHGCNPTCTRGEFRGWTLASLEDVKNFSGDAGIHYGDANSYSLIAGFLVNYVGFTFASPYFSLVEGTGFTRDLISPTKVAAIKLSTGLSRPFWGPPTPTYSQVETDVDSSSTQGAWLYRNRVPASPEANFCAYPTLDLAPLNVDFFDRSYQATGWLWDFGDGSTSTEPNPSHKYALPGSYTVSLTVNGTGGVDTATVTDYVVVQTPAFSDAANNEVAANYYSDVVVYNWNTTYSNYELMKVFLEKANDSTAKAYAQATIATNHDTSFWGNYAITYMAAEMNARSAALPFVDLSKYYASYGYDDMAEYYSAYAISLNASADVYNGSAVWCSSMEGGRAGNEQSTFPGSPSFYSAASNGWFANINYAASLAYLIHAVDNPAYLPLVQLYASKAYDYAQAAYADATDALAAAGTDYTIWALNAVQYGANDLKFRSESVAYFESAVSAYRSGQLENAFQLLVLGYGKGQYADAENARLIWYASMESKGGTR